MNSGVMRIKGINFYKVLIMVIRRKRKEEKEGALSSPYL